MTIDPAKLLASPPIKTRHEISRHDTILYALGIGAEELKFVYEEQLETLPMMALVMAYPGFFLRNPEYGADWKRILHADQSLEIHAPLPIEGVLLGETTFDAVYDKGPEKGALVYTSRRITSEDGTHVATATAGAFLRGDGGCGSTHEVAPQPHKVPEDRPPDEVVELTTGSNQAMIYRLSGDLNPLHVDPEVAKSAGFDSPILHGLCTYGVVGRALLATCADNDPARLKSMKARFSAPVFPGETIITEIWRESDTQVSFRARLHERNVVVLSNGVGEIV